MGSVCVRIKHERNLCSKCLWQSLQTFGSISCFSQIHCWICVKFESVLAQKVQKALPKIQLDQAFCKGATRVGNRGGCSGVHGMKPLDFGFNQLFSLKYTMGFVSNLNQFQFRSCRRPSQKFSLIGLSVWELRQLEVEGVEFSVFSSNQASGSQLRGLTLDQKHKIKTYEICLNMAPFILVSNSNACQIRMLYVVVMMNGMEGFKPSNMTLK